MSLPLWAERMLVLFKREIKQRASYRMTMVLSALSGLTGLVVYGLLGSSAVTSVTTQSYGMSFASYLISGVAFSSIATNGPGLFIQYASPVTLEEVMVTPTGFQEYVVLSSVLGILTALGTAALFFTLSIFMFQLVFSYNLATLITVIGLGVLSSVGLGFIGLGLQLVYKQTSILSWVLFSLTGILGNMLVPVQILPGIVQSLSYLTPQYYFFTGIRVGLGSDVAPAPPLLASFAVYAVILLLTGLFFLNRSLRIIRRTGSHRWT